MKDFAADPQQPFRQGTMKPEQLAIERLPLKFRSSKPSGHPKKAAASFAKEST